MRSTSPRSCSAHAPSLPAWLALLLLALIPAAAMAQRSTPIQITQPGGAGGDVFAFTVGIDGDTMVVGAYGDNVGASTDQGSASVYRWTGSGWTFEATLIASDGAPGDLFGVSAAISGDTIVVGALGDDVGAFPDQGSAYVFTRSGTTWTQQAKLTAADGSNDDAFGYSVAIRGNTIVAGAYADDIGTNTDQGSAYVFIRTGTVWTQQAKLTAPVPSNTSFGFSVGTDGNSVIVGAYRDDVGANLNQGSAFIFSRSGSLWTQQAKLVASDGAASDSFGFSVAIDGETVIVGAYTDAIGVNTNQGSAYVFTRSGTAWSQQAKLTTPGGATGDLFGSAVALSGNTAIVGAFADDIGATTNQGSASIFTRTGTAWTQQAQLTAPDGAANENFGVSVAVSGDLTLVGAYSDTIGANTIQGSAWVFSRVGSGWIGPDFQTSATAGAPADSFAYSVAISGDTAIVGAWTDDVGANTNQGSAYIFVRSGSAWIQQAQLTATGGAANDVFGSFVAIDGDTAVVGALSDDVGASIDQGSAYVFTRSGTVWTQQAQLLATGGAAGDGLGSSVAIDGDTVIVGAYLDDVGANTNQGSAYVFTRTGTTWTQQAQLISLGGATSDTFGISVALSGNTAIVGAYLDDVGANTNQGSAYVFTRSGTVWTQQAQLNATGGTTEDRFGFSVAIDGDTAIIGAPNDDVGANNAQGAAYVFTRSGSTWTQQAQLTATGGAVNDFFGVSVALSGNTAIVGANADDVGANSDQGSAYIFTRSGSTWTQQALLTTLGGEAADQFGNSVAISGDSAIVGAYADDVGPNANQGSVWFFSVAADDFSAAHNDVTNVTYPTLAAAFLPAQSGQQITATEAAWRTAGNLNTFGRSLGLFGSGNIRTVSTATLDLGGSSALISPAGASIDVFGSLRAAGFIDVLADRFRLGSRGIMTARTSSSISINAPTAQLDGQTRLEQGASLTFSGNATAIGPTTANLNSSLTAGSTFTNIDTFTITSGTISTPLFLNRDTANIFGTSALFGSYSNDSGAITTIRSGTLFIFGSLTNNGTIVGTVCAGCSGSPPTLDLTGSLVLGPDANLTMPFQDALVRLGGNFDAAITNHTRYDMAQATLQFEGTGAAQTLEAMSIDRGQDITALDRTIAGNFPIGTLRVGPTPSLVRTTDARDNDLQGQTVCEAIYVDTLIIDAGSTLDTSACVTIYYSTLINNGTVTDPAKLVPIEPCAADFDGSGFLDADDFVFYLDQFARGCVGPGEDVFGANPDCFKSADFDQSTFVDVDDFVAYFAAFQTGC